MALTMRYCAAFLIFLVCLFPANAQTIHDNIIDLHDDSNFGIKTDLNDDIRGRSVSDTTDDNRGNVFGDLSDDRNVGSMLDQNDDARNGLDTNQDDRDANINFGLFGFPGSGPAPSTASVSSQAVGDAFRGAPLDQTVTTRNSGTGNSNVYDTLLNLLIDAAKNQPAQGASQASANINDHLTLRPLSPPGHQQSFESVPSQGRLDSQAVQSSVSRQSQQSMSTGLSDNLAPLLARALGPNGANILPGDANTNSNSNMLANNDASAGGNYDLLSLLSGSFLSSNGNGMSRNAIRAPASSSGFGVEYISALASDDSASSDSDEDAFDLSNMFSYDDSRDADHNDDGDLFSRWLRGDRSSGKEQNAFGQARFSATENQIINGGNSQNSLLRQHEQSRSNDGSDDKYDDNGYFPWMRGLHSNSHSNGNNNPFYSLGGNFDLWDD